MVYAIIGGIVFVLCVILYIDDVLHPTPSDDYESDTNYD